MIWKLMEHIYADSAVVLGERAEEAENSKGHPESSKNQVWCQYLIVVLRGRL